MAAQVVTGVLRIPLEQLQHGPNVREHLDRIEELAEELKYGQEHPIVVIPIATDLYEVFDGNRRLKAAHLAKLAYLDAVARKPLTAAERIERQLVMGMSGRSLNPMEEARAIETLMFEHGRTREQIAGRFHRTPVWVRDRLALLQLRPDEQRSVAAGTLSVRSAVSIVTQRRSPFAQARRLQATAQTKTGRRREKHCRTCTCRNQQGET